MFYQIIYLKKIPISIVLRHCRNCFSKVEFNIKINEGGVIKKSQKEKENTTNAKRKQKNCLYNSIHICKFCPRTFLYFSISLRVGVNIKSFNNKFVQFLCTVWLTPRRLGSDTAWLWKSHCIVVRAKDAKKTFGFRYPVASEVWVKRCRNPENFRKRHSGDNCHVTFHRRSSSSRPMRWLEYLWYIIGVGASLTIQKSEARKEPTWYCARDTDNVPHLVDLTLISVLWVVFCFCVSTRWIARFWKWSRCCWWSSECST